ncbi:lipocalin family protein [Flavobacterium sp. UW10123]|uniref:lipocalin family protein n=1 Tax=Flavobacterium sp. UW10123 TaxID=3230800 RepID=UPI00339647E7
MKLKITALFGIIIFGLTSCQKEVLGKYYNIEDDKAIHYIDFKADGTFFHYYKKDSIERSHSGTWTREDNKIHILNWEEYSKEYLEIISGMGKAEFGRTLGNQIFWIHGARLDITPDGSNNADYIKEEDVEEVRAERKKIEAERKAYIKDKDTFIILITRPLKRLES